MISRIELKQIARGRLRDARLLLRAGRHDGAVYLGGYVVEMALKERICRTLGWNEFPHTAREFSNYQSFKTHDLNVLRRLSGVEGRIRVRYLTEWSAVTSWNPEVRYNSPGSVNDAEARVFLDAASVLLRVL